jgi:hypothetical protein
MVVSCMPIEAFKMKFVIIVVRLFMHFSSVQLGE